LEATGKRNEDAVLFVGRERGRLPFYVKWICHGVAVNCETRHGIPVGTVFVRNYHHGKNGDPLFMPYTDGIYSVLRAQGMHVQNGYDKEKSHMFFSQRMLDWMLEIAHEMPEDTADEMETYRNKMFELVDSLKCVRNEFKVEAKRRIRKALTPEDSLGRRNWPSRWMLIWSSNDKLDERISQSGYIRRAVDERKLQIIKHLDDVWRLRTNVLSYITEMFRLLRQTGGESGRVFRIARNLQAYATKMQGVYVAPFGNGVFPRCVDELETAAGFMEDGVRRTEALELLDRTRRSLRLLQMARRLERGLAMVSASMHDGHRWNMLDLERFQYTLKFLRSTFEASDIEQGFERPILSNVIEDIKEAQNASQDLLTLELETVKQALKRATKRF